MSDSFATPWTAIHQAPLSLGFPSRECWSGLPFPSPGDLPDPVTNKVLVSQSCLTPCELMDCSQPGSSVHEIFQSRILKWVAIPFSRGLSQLRNRSRISRIAGLFFTVRATMEAYEQMFFHPKLDVSLHTESRENIFTIELTLFRPQREQKSYPLYMIL